jgi:hypothetical protein
MDENYEYDYPRQGRWPPILPPYHPLLPERSNALPQRPPFNR